MGRHWASDIPPQPWIEARRHVGKQATVVLCWDPEFTATGHLVSLSSDMDCVIDSVRLGGRHTWPALYVRKPTIGEACGEAGAALRALGRELRRASRIDSLAAWLDARLTRGGTDA